jgi:tRNA pseudouridine38-40 synthase
VLRLAEPAALTVAGRTDAGVHARGQVSHVDIPADLPVAGLERRLNGTLPDDIRVHRVGVAPEGFDARFSAIWRRYAYRLSDGPESADPLRRREVLPYPWPLDLSAMNASAAQLLGEHDFAAYCKRREGATTIRALLDFGWERTDAGLVVARVVADAFCHSMVRALVGALLAVGTGRKPVEWPGQVLAAGVRDSAVQVLPARGLTLEEVGYPPDGELAARADEARRMRSPLAR